MNKKTTPTKTAAPAADDYLAQGIKGERKKSGLGTFLDRLPAPFISLNSVIAAVAEANEGSFREAAQGLRILEREDDFPSWYRWADAKSKGKLDTEIGAAWGPKLLQHAEMFGEPVEFPHDYYRDCGYDLSAMPEGSVHHFLAVGPTLGFQRSDIGPFLTRHGIKGFDLGCAVERKDAGPAGKVSARGVQRQRAQEVAILSALYVRGHDPKALEIAPKSNKPWPLREGIRLELNLGTEVMRKAWARLRKDRRIQDA